MTPDFFWLAVLVVVYLAHLFLVFVVHELGHMGYLIMIGERFTYGIEWHGLDFNFYVQPISRLLPWDHFWFLLMGPLLASLYCLLLVFFGGWIYWIFFLLNLAGSYKDFYSMTKIKWA